MKLILAMVSLAAIVLVPGSPGAPKATHAFGTRGAGRLSHMFSTWFANAQLTESHIQCFVFLLPQQD